MAQTTEQDRKNAQARARRQERKAAGGLCSACPKPSIVAIGYCAKHLAPHVLELKRSRSGRTLRSMQNLNLAIAAYTKALYNAAIRKAGE